MKDYNELPDDELATRLEGMRKRAQERLMIPDIKATKTVEKLTIVERVDYQGFKTYEITHKGGWILI
jgi:hypothetical protein